MKKEKQRLIEDTGLNYNDIIFHDDYLPRELYVYQIGLRNGIIEASLANKKYRYVLDLGSGTGFHLGALAGHAENLLAADLSLNALRESKKRYDCGHIACDVNMMPFKPGSVDCLWIAGVLHHVPRDLENVLCGNVVPALRRGGTLLIDEPNAMNPLNHLNMKLSKADPTGDERPLSMRKVERLLEKGGCRIVRSREYELLSPFGILSKNKAVARACERFDRWADRTILRKFSFRWFIQASKI